MGREHQGIWTAFGVGSMAGGLGGILVLAVANAQSSRRQRLSDLWWFHPALYGAAVLAVVGVYALLAALFLPLPLPPLRDLDKARPKHFLRTRKALASVSGTFADLGEATD